MLSDVFLDISYVFDTLIVVSGRRSCGRMRMDPLTILGPDIEDVSLVSKKNPVVISEEILCTRAGNSVEGRCESSDVYSFGLLLHTKDRYIGLYRSLVGRGDTSLPMSYGNILSRRRFFSRSYPYPDTG